MLGVVGTQIVSIAFLIGGNTALTTISHNHPETSMIILLVSLCGVIIIAQTQLINQFASIGEKSASGLRKQVATHNIVISPQTRLLLYAFTTGLSLVAIGLLVYLLLNVNTYILHNNPSLVWILVAASFLLSPLYYLLAAPYRAIASLRDRVMVELLASSYSPRKYSPTADVCIIDTEGVIATVMRVWGRGVIVISTGVIEAVREQTKSEEVPADEAIAALLAHEEAHILHGDLLQVTRLNLLSVLTLTPRVLLYLLHDFSSAESDADDHAVEQVSAEAVTTVLQAIKKSQRNSWAETTNLGTARFSSIRSIEQALSVKLGVLYSDFTLSETHARLETRIDRIKNEHSDQS